MQPLEAPPSTWDEYAWPDWVPPRVRRAVEGYWRAQPTAGPDRWLADAAAAGAPALGDPVIVGGRAPGRYVHCYGRQGRVVHADGGLSVSWVLFGACGCVWDLGQAR